MFFECVIQLHSLQKHIFLSFLLLNYKRRKKEVKTQRFSDNSNAEACQQHFSRKINIRKKRNIYM